MTSDEPHRPPIRIGMIGYGAAARTFHEPVIAVVPGLEITRTVAHRSEDPSPMFDDPSIELVVITTPNDSHAELVERALIAGKHVVVEKPFATRSADAYRLAAMASERGLVLAVHHNRRWDGDFLTVRRIVEQGLLGDLVAFESHFDRFRNSPKPNAWREKLVEGAGVLFDLGPHLVDQAVALFGAPRDITGDVRIERAFAAVDDAFTIVLHYDRLTVSLGAGMLFRTSRPRFALYGTVGSFVKHGVDPQEEALKAGRTPGGPGWGVESPERWGSLDTDIGGLHLRSRVETLPGSYPSFYANVRDAIASAAELAVEPTRAALAIRVLELARESCDRGRRLELEPPFVSDR